MQKTDALTTSAAPTFNLDRLLETDFTQVRPFVFLAIVFLLVRLPFVNYGYGTDPDAWRVAMTAHHLLETGDYFPSRLPGNPLHELIITVFIPGGWLAANLATALSALVGVYLFAKILKHHQLPYAGLVTVGFAFTPLLYINSISTMDYMWTLTFILAAYYSMVSGRTVWAGIFIGLAIGCRLQSVILLPAFAFYLWRANDWREVFPMGFAAGGVAAICFSPVLTVYGLDFLNYYDAKVGYQDVIRLLGKEALGILGGLGVLAGAAISLPRLIRLPMDAWKDPFVGSWVVVIAIYFASFTRLPHEIAYLIPVFPFGFLIMARYFTRLALCGTIAAIVFAGVLDITTESDAIGPSSFTTASIGRGLILSNAVTMDAQRDFSNEIMKADIPNHSVVMSGFIFPQLAERERGRLDAKILQRDYAAISMLSDRGEAVDEERDIRYVWLLTFETFEALRSQGYNMYLVPDAAGGTAALYDYRPTLLGASFLKLERQSPSAGKGTASTDR
ncbi:MAG: ArnT family glycosyltransferase [Dehalococcoidia bacterium]